MALIVVMAGESAAFKKYDIVEVLPDDANAGKEVYLPTFFIFKMNGDDLQYLKDAWLTPKKTVGMITTQDTIEPRLYFYNFDAKLTQEQINSVKNSEDIMLIEIQEADIEEKF